MTFQMPSFEERGIIYVSSKSGWKINQVSKGSKTLLINCIKPECHVKTTDYLSIKWASNDVPQNNSYDVNIWPISRKS